MTQTTLSIDDTQEIIAYLKQRFPHICGLPKADICYATTNRQTAVKELIKSTPNIVILGSKNSSNSRHLKETALKTGLKEPGWLTTGVSLTGQRLTDLTVWASARELPPPNIWLRSCWQSLPAVMTILTNTGL